MAVAVNRPPLCRHCRRRTNPSAESSWKILTSLASWRPVNGEGEMGAMRGGTLLPVSTSSDRVPRASSVHCPHPDRP